MSGLGNGKNQPLVAIVMGSKSDAIVMKSAKEVLDILEIPCEARVLSAHRTPHELTTWVKELKNRGFCVVIAGAGASAALPGSVAAQTLLPVIGVPLNATALKGIESLLAMAQMPFGTPVATMAIGEAGAKNAALLATRMLALKDRQIEERLFGYSKKVHESAVANSLVDAFV
jgi:5-(carboxyamino)imidazole ribonucleotide mutase